MKYKHYINTQYIEKNGLIRLFTTYTTYFPVRWYNVSILYKNDIVMHFNAMVHMYMYDLLRHSCTTFCDLIVNRMCIL